MDVPLSPALAVESVRQIVNDGSHNAFTDLCRFRDRLWLTFRSCPDGHMISRTSRIVVLASDDEGETWEREFDFNAPERDVRDPHFLVFRDTLFVYTGAWLVEGRYDINRNLGYCAWTTDGVSWHGPRHLEGTYGHYIWRAAAFEGRAYLCGRRKRGFAQTADHGDGVQITESAMLESEDGFIWRFRALFREEYGNETAFLFETDGSVLAIARGGSGSAAQVCRSHPPYTDWSRTDLNRNVKGPLLARWGDRDLVGGRNYRPDKSAVTTVYWLVDDELEELAELPSGGDTSYPGFVQLSATEGLLSYYSSHEGSGTTLAPSAIYLARLRLT